MDYLLSLDQQLISQMILQSISTIVLALILAKVLYNPVKDFMKKRSEGIKAQLETAKKSEENAKVLKNDYEKKLGKIEIERTEILEDARKRGKDTEFEIIQEAKNEAKAIKERAMKDIEREKERAKDEMRTQIIELSSELAKKYVEKTIDEETQNKLLDEVISSLGEAKWQA